MFTRRHGNQRRNVTSGSEIKASFQTERSLHTCFCPDDEDKVCLKEPEVLQWFPGSFDRRKLLFKFLLLVLIDTLQPIKIQYSLGWTSGRRQTKNESDDDLLHLKLSSKSEKSDKQKTFKNQID